MRRIYAIDFVRGLVIVIMALDHVRDLLHTTSISHDPVDLRSTTVALFFTRWITHFCAPVFVFLAGTSAYIMMRNQSNLAQTRRFLFTRGLWLMLLEFTIINFGIWFDIYFQTMFFQVIFAIGFGFFVLSIFISVPAHILGMIGLSIIALHNLLPVLKISDLTGNFLWSLFFSPNFISISKNFVIVILYPLIPWLGILLFGFGVGRVFELPEDKRNKTLLTLGATCILVFVVLRLGNFYGDPSPWAVQKTTVFSVLSFLNISKYPPSLLFTAITMGGMFLILGLSDKLHRSISGFFHTFGRVPLFFYIGHWYLIHILLVLLLIWENVPANQIPTGPMSFGRPVTGFGLNLSMIYLVWISLILFFYPLCRWYGRYRSQHPEKRWLSYF
jgi:uncharacterized membrane protein